MTRVSVQGRSVLEALVESEEGLQSPNELTQLIVRGGASLSVARASLSRTLRRLWSAGLVELESTRGKTFSELRQDSKDRAERARRDPAGFYQGYCKWVSTVGGRPIVASADEWLALKQRQARRPPTGRVRVVILTEAGRDAVNCPGAVTINRTMVPPEANA